MKKDMKIEYKPAGELKPWDRNPKFHDIESLKRSVERYGPRWPILVQKGSLRIIAGHGRLEAYTKLGIDPVPVTIWDCTDQEADAFAIADNQLTITGGWDDDALSLVIQEMPIEFQDTLGFDMDELDMYLNLNIDEPEIMEDEFTEDVEPTCKRGQLWRLGDHRLLCGDSTSKEDMKLLMGGVKADMVFTDPPYGVSIGDKNKMLDSFDRGGRCTKNIEHDTDSPEKLKEMLLAAMKNTHDNMKDTAAYYLCSPQGSGLGMMMMMMMMMNEAGLIARHVLIWVKNQPTFSLGRLDYDYQHEPILYGWKKTHTFYGNGAHTKSIWMIDRPRESKLHPTMKPIDLVANAIQNSSRKGDMVLDPFGGSGSTLIACEQTQRHCRMIELDPHYCDVIIHRWEELTGQKAELVGGE